MRSGNSLFCGVMLLSFATLLAGCAAPKITMCKLIPGTVSEAARMKKIAVLPFDGSYGPEFAAELESSLANIRVKDSLFYDVVSRTALDKVMSEQNLSHSGLVDTRSAVRVGKMVGAQGLYVGQVTTAMYHDTPYKEARTECIERNKKGKCLSYRNYDVNCLKRTAELTVVPKLVDVETGQICYSETFKRTEESKGCSDTSAPKNGEQMLTALRGSIIQTLGRQVAPHSENVDVKLLADSDDISSDAAKEKLKQGMAFAENNRMARACEIWEEGRSLAPSSISYLHNLAVCAEADGNLEKAQAMLREADKKLLKPNDIISASMARVEADLASKKKLQEQLGRK